MVCMTTRTDIHRPVNLVTEDYEYLFCFDNRQPGRLIGVDMAWWRSITNFDPAMEGRGTTQCHHCGAHIRYVALLRHVPTGYAIAVGETCLDNRFSLATSEFQKLRKAAALDRQQQRIKTAALEAIADLPENLQAALVKDADLSEIGLEGWALNTFGDIRRKLWSYGNISERQVALLARLLSEIPERAAAKAAQEAEVQVPAPSGRVVFTGAVVSRKWHDNDFGGALKLTVKVTTDAGVWLVWVTCPSAINPELGDTVSMKATLTQSNDKPHFAFGKRPSKATIVARHNENDLPSALD